MKFDSAGLVDEVLWDLRIAEQPRADDRTLILKTFNGNPPFNEATVEENNIQVNRNSLQGPNILSQARRQWTNAFIKPHNFFTAKPDSGPAHKKQAWATSFTNNANRPLKRDRRMIGQTRAEGANTLLFGLGPSMWKDRRTVIPTAIPVGSLLVPSETEIDDFDNLEYFAIFREWTPSQLYDMTHGPKVDPGWNMPLVRAQLDYIKEEIRKSPNSLAFQYMPERIEELIKQDKGFYGSDAVPTVDVWDFYFREAENGKGWYRRIVLDWGIGANLPSYIANKNRPESKNKVGDKYEFLYTSEKRKYADTLDQILFCQFGDCSAYAPFKYHSVRGLGWMLWGICDLEDRLHCKFNEALFEQMMWFFQTAGNQDLLRLKKANFEHMGIIPQGIRFLTPAERYIPNTQLIQLGFERNRMLMNQASMSYTQEFAGQAGDSRETATRTMAIVNASQSLANSIMEQAYQYATFKYREMVRRLCIKNSTDPMAREFRLKCLQDGIPQEMLDVDKWDIEPEQIVGGGNKTVQMAQVQFLNTIRRNLPPDGQRMVDHLSVEAATDQPDLAEEIAPIGEQQPISSSTADAQQATMRLMAGLPYALPKDAVFEDYVVTWTHDLALQVQKAMQRGGMATPDELNGMMNMGKHISALLEFMGQNEDDKERVTRLSDSFSQVMNLVKAFAQRLQQAMKAGMKKNGQGAPGAAAEQAGVTQAKVQSQQLIAQAKAANMRESHAQRTQQRQISWQNEERRKDQQLVSDIRREGVSTRHELMADRLKSLSE